MQVYALVRRNSLMPWTWGTSIVPVASMHETRELRHVTIAHFLTDPAARMAAVAGPSASASLRLGPCEHGALSVATGSRLQLSSSVAMARVVEGLLVASALPVEAVSGERAAALRCSPDPYLATRVSASRESLPALLSRIYSTALAGRLVGSDLWGRSCCVQPIPHLARARKQRDSAQRAFCNRALSSMDMLLSQT